MFIPIDSWTLILKKGWKWSFSYETKAPILLSQWEKLIWGAQSLKEMRLQCESMFMQNERQSLILKMVEREVFLFKPKHRFIYPNG